MLVVKHDDIAVVHYLLLRVPELILSFFFFLNDPPPPETYPLPLPDALPISSLLQLPLAPAELPWLVKPLGDYFDGDLMAFDGLPVHQPATALRQRLWAQLRAVKCHQRSEEHTSELQSQSNLVCRLLLEKKKV